MHEGRLGHADQDPIAAPLQSPLPIAALPGEKATVVSTHVLVTHEQIDRLRELSKRTRVAQSEYLREAVDDLLAKYRKLDRLEHDGG
jgi:hypothetical protein